MNDDRNAVTLSERGLARRAEMLDGLKREVSARGRRRRAARAGVAAAPLLALSLAMIWPALRPPSAPDHPTDSGGNGALTISPTPSTPSLAHVAFSEVRTQTDLASRTITDDELLDLLRQAGHAEAGIARRGAECIVVGLPPTGAGSGPGSDASPAPGRRTPSAPAPLSHSLGE